MINLSVFTASLQVINNLNVRTARCVKMMGKGVVKVVHRCDDAKENNNLGERQMMNNKTYSLEKKLFKHFTK